MKLLLAKISFLVAILIAISSCEKNSCKHVTCPTNLECSHGACICPDGYEGTNCDTLSYKKFVGNYQVNESCQSGSIGTPVYIVHLSWGEGGADTLQPGLVIINPLFDAVSAQVFIVNIPGSLGLNFNVPLQTVGSYTFSGTGGASVDSATHAVTHVYLYLNYGTDGTNTDYSCTEILTKF